MIATAQVLLAGTGFTLWCMSCFTVTTVVRSLKPSFCVICPMFGGIAEDQDSLNCHHQSSLPTLLLCACLLNAPQLSESFTRQMHDFVCPNGNHLPEWEHQVFGNCLNYCSTCLLQELSHFLWVATMDSSHPGR